MSRQNGSECACPTCKRVFASERAFDAHRIGDYASPRAGNALLAPLGRVWSSTTREGGGSSDE